MKHSILIYFTTLVLPSRLLTTAAPINTNPANIPKTDLVNTTRKRPSLTTTIILMPTPIPAKLADSENRVIFPYRPYPISYPPPILPRASDISNVDESKSNNDKINDNDIPGNDIPGIPADGQLSYGYAAVATATNTPSSTTPPSAILESFSTPSLTTSPEIDGKNFRLPCPRPFPRLRPDPDPVPRPNANSHTTTTPPPASTTSDVHKRMEIDTPHGKGKPVPGIPSNGQLSWGFPAALSSTLATATATASNILALAPSPSLPPITTTTTLRPLLAVVTEPSPDSPPLSTLIPKEHHSPTPSPSAFHPVKKGIPGAVASGTFNALVGLVSNDLSDEITGSDKDKPTPEHEKEEKQREEEKKQKEKEEGPKKI